MHFFSYCNYSFAAVTIAKKGFIPLKKFLEDFIMAGAQRPTVATVFAILHFVFGGIGLIGGIFAALGAGALAAILGSKFIFFVIPTIIGIAVSALLIYAGVTLITNKKNAIKINLIYAICSVALAVINVALQVAILGTGISWFGLILGLIYPALIYFLIVKNEEVKKFYA